MVRCSPAIRHTWHIWFLLPVIVAVLWLNEIWNVLGAFAKLRKATIRFVVFLCPSVRLHGTTRLPLDGFSLNLIFEYFSRNCLENSTFIQIWQEWRALYMNTSRSILLRIRNVSDKVVENIKTHILCSVTFFPRISCRLWGNVEKYVRAGQPADGNMAHAHCMLDTEGYRHTLRICKTYCFSTATVVARTRLDVTLYLHCLSCLYCKCGFLDLHRCVGRRRSLFCTCAHSDSSSKNRISASSCLPSSSHRTNCHEICGCALLPISPPVPALAKSGQE